MPTDHPPPLRDDERTALWKQYARAHAEAQENFDTSTRTLAAAGVAITVALVTALKVTEASAVCAIVLFLLSLACNLLSYVTAQLDLRERLDYVRAGKAKGREETGWTHGTWALNTLCGSALFAGGCFLTYYVASTV
ncbi:MAG: hypothetical protein ACKVUT_18410 [Gaiella sp.]